MRRNLPPVLASALLVTALLWPAPAPAQDRGLGVAQSSPAGRYYALVVGNNDYKSLPRLKTAEADAREVAALLKDFYGFETRLLMNATRGQIMSALNAYRRELGPDSSLLVYYAGHGINDREADKAYWLPVDATRDDTSNWIIADEITTAVKVIPARHVLVVSDSCYSGTLTRGLGESLPPPNAREQFLQRMLAGRSRTLMASGGNEPVADGGGGRHSVFAAALLRGLREIDRPRFTGAELFRHYVEEPVAGRADQTPEYNPLRNSGHESGDFVFVKVKVDGKSVEVTVKAPAAVDTSVFELEYWNAIKNSSDPEEYRGYLAKYPNGQFADIARRRAAGGPPPATPTGGGATADAATAPGPAGASNAGAGAKAFPGTAEGARALLAEFVRTGADHAALSRALRPTRADCDAVFTPEFAARAEAAYAPLWNSGEAVVAPKQGQTHVLIYSATSEELRDWTGAAAEFPGGWKRMGARLRPGVTFYRFKFVEPGESLGMAYDGLAFVNGHWRIFPKPWRLVGTQ